MPTNAWRAREQNARVCIWSSDTGQKGLDRKERLFNAWSLKMCFPGSWIPDSQRTGTTGMPGPCWGWQRVPAGPLWLPGTFADTHLDRLGLQGRNKTVKALEAEDICSFGGNRRT